MDYDFWIKEKVKFEISLWLILTKTNKISIVKST